MFEEFLAFLERDKLGFALLCIFFALTGLIPARHLRALRSRKPDPPDDNSGKRLAVLRARQEQEREQRIHQHFRDFQSFRESITDSVKLLEFKADEMEKDVGELKNRIEHMDRSHAEHREQLLERLTKLEAAARTLAQMALDTRHEIALFGTDRMARGSE